MSIMCVLLVFCVFQFLYNYQQHIVVKGVLHTKSLIKHRREPWTLVKIDVGLVIL